MLSDFSSICAKTDRNLKISNFYISYLFLEIKEIQYDVSTGVPQNLPGFATPAKILSHDTLISY